MEFGKEPLLFSNEDSPMANLMLSVVGSFAEFERSLIRECQREGIALDRQRVPYHGRRRAFTLIHANEMARRRPAERLKQSSRKNTGPAGKRCINTCGVPHLLTQALRLHAGRIRQHHVCATFGSSDESGPQSASRCRFLDLGMRTGQRKSGRRRAHERMSAKGCKHDLRN